LIEIARDGNLPRMSNAEISAGAKQARGGGALRHRNAIASFLAVLLTMQPLAVSQICRATELQPATSAAYDAYVKEAEARMSANLRERRSFLWIEDIAPDERSRAYADLRAGRVVIENARGSKASNALAVSGGLIHDWQAVVFVPAVSIDEVLALLQDYDHDNEYFSPDVERSKLLSRDGENFRVYLRLKRKYVLTAVFDTEYDVRYTKLDATRTISESRSSKIEEIQNEGANEKHLAPAEDHGYLWRLDSYWRFEQANGGVFIECEAISLSRDVPAAVAWAVDPFIAKIPRESLRNTLQAARSALQKKYATSNEYARHVAQVFRPEASSSRANEISNGSIK
jgi:hypothetical protein